MPVSLSSPAPTPALGAVPLAEVPLLATLPAADLAAMAPLFAPRAYERDDVIFHEGEAPEWLFILVAGQVKLVKHSEDGRDVILHVALPGDVLGGVSAFGRRPHPFSAQAMAPTVALRVAGKDFAAIMDAHPAVARATLDDLVERLTEAHETMKSLAVERVERRVARQLLKLAGRLGQPLGRRPGRQRRGREPGGTVDGAPVASGCGGHGRHHRGDSHPGLVALAARRPGAGRGRIPGAGGPGGASRRGRRSRGHDPCHGPYGRTDLQYGTIARRARWTHGGAGRAREERFP